MSDPRPVKRILRREQKLDKEAAGMWRMAALFAHPVCPITGWRTDIVHHVVDQQHIRRAGHGENVRWDVRNAMALSQKASDEHHSRKRPILRSELPASVFEFVADYPEFERYLERTYPDE